MLPSIALFVVINPVHKQITISNYYSSYLRIIVVIMCRPSRIQQNVENRKELTNNGSDCF